MKKYIIFCVIGLGFSLRFFFFLKNPSFDYTKFGPDGNFPFNVENEILPPETSYFKGYPPRDSQEYKFLALNLLQHHRFSWDSEPVVFRTPGYPLFIAAIYSLFGIKEWVVILFQVFLSITSIYLVYLLGKNSFNELAGIVAGALFLIDFNSIFFSSLFMAETLFIFLLLFGTFLFLKDKFPYSGLLFGLAVLTRPIAFYLFIPLLFLQRRFKKLILFLVFFFLPFLPWMIRNFKVYGSFSLSSIDGWNLLFSNASMLEADETGTPLDEVRSKFMKELWEASPDADSLNNPLLLSREAQKLGINRIKQSPFRYAILHFKGMLKLLVRTKVDDVILKLRGANITQSRLLRVLKEDISLGLRIRILLIAGLEIFINFIAVGLGFIGLIKRRCLPKLLFFIIGFYFFILSGGPFSEARFRLPMMPYFYLLSGSVVANFIMKRKTERTKEQRNK